MEQTIDLPSGAHRVAVTGAAERHLKIIRECLRVRITSRNGHVRVEGEPRQVHQATHIIDRLKDAAVRNKPIDRQQLLEMIASVEHQTGADAPSGEHVLGESLSVYLPGKHIKPLTPGQRGYLDAIEHHDLVISVGPAGTGKTYIAVAAAVAMLKAGQTRKLVLARPAVEAGEKLGFLPGDMQQKVNPYLRPLLDALHDMMTVDQVQRLIDADVIEIIPLAFMRGRTLNDAVIILDEAQNETRTQMIMFLTRMGQGSKIVVTGDPTQVDLPDHLAGGLPDAMKRLKSIEGVDVVRLRGRDIVRHRLVTEIVAAYAKQPSNGQ